MLGRSLKQLTHGKEKGNRIVISEIEDMVSCQDRKYRLIINTRTWHKEFYDLENDSGEQNSLTLSNLIKNYEEK